MPDGRSRTPDPPFTGAFVFAVDGKDIGAFTEVSGLTVTLDVEEITEGGNNEATIKMPGRLKWPNLVLKRGVTNDDRLLEWILECAGEGLAAQGNTVTKRDGSIRLLDAAHATVRTWSFRQAFPVKWAGPQLAAGSNAVATEELEVCHGGFTAA